MGIVIEGLPVEPRSLEVEAPASELETRAPTKAEASEFERILRRVGGAIDRGEAILDGAASGAYHRMDAATLIALQAGIYRYSEAVDLVGKLVDRATGAARTVLQAGH